MGTHDNNAELAYCGFVVAKYVAQDKTVEPQVKSRLGFVDQVFGEND